MKIPKSTNTTSQLELTNKNPLVVNNPILHKSNTAPTKKNRPLWCINFLVFIVFCNSVTYCHACISKQGRD